MSSTVKVITSTDIKYEPLLHHGCKGWKKSLFLDVDKMEDYLCAHCRNVCKDAVELGCDHSDEQIELFCNFCLQEIVQSNGGNCPIDSSHSHPPIQSNRQCRRQILKLKVMCRYSRMYDVDHEQSSNDNNMGIYDTADIKEEGSYNTDKKYCDWKGSLHELITTHLKQCKCASKHELFINMTHINQKIAVIEKYIQNNTAINKEFDHLKNTIFTQQNKMNQKIEAQNEEIINLTQKLQKIERQLNEQGTILRALETQPLETKNDIKTDDYAKYRKQYKDMGAKWEKFPESHPCLKISNNRLTVSGEAPYYNTRGTVLFGDFVQTGFFAVEFKLDAMAVRAGVAIITTKFGAWKSFNWDQDWFLVHHNNADPATVNARNEDNPALLWKKRKISASPWFGFMVGDIVSIMIDADNKVGEIKNQTKGRYIKVRLPDRPCGIALYCADCQWTAIRQIFNRDEY